MVSPIAKIAWVLICMCTILKIVHMDASKSCACTVGTMLGDEDGSKSLEMHEAAMQSQA